MAIDKGQKSKNKCVPFFTHAVISMARLEDYYAPSKEKIVKALKSVMEY